MTGLKPFLNTYAVYFHSTYLQVFECLSDERAVACLDLHQIDILRSSRGKFNADNSCAGEQIQHAEVAEIKAVVQYVKEAFTGIVSCGSRPESRGGQYQSSFKISANYSHDAAVKRFNHRCIGISFMT